MIEGVARNVGESVQGIHSKGRRGGHLEVMSS